MLISKQTEILPYPLSALRLAMRLMIRRAEKSRDTKRKPRRSGAPSTSDARLAVLVVLTLLATLTGLLLLLAGLLAATLLLLAGLLIALLLLVRVLALVRILVLAHCTILSTSAVEVLVDGT
jgi:uncharacterized membrane protein